MSDKTQVPAFEETLAQLETLVTRMEDGQMSLEEALSAFETGIKLTRDCQQALQQAELKVQMLMRADAAPEAFNLENAGLSTDAPNTHGVAGD